jgi:hypothetical protein
LRRARRYPAIVVGGVVVVAATGCMKIYTDPELPDIEVEWTDTDCIPPTTDIALVLVNRDDGTRVETRTACGDLGTTFADVARERHALQGLSLDLAADVVSSASAEIDLRNGLDERAYLFFGGTPSNYRVAWTFETGTTCASLDATFMLLDFTPLGSEPYTLGTVCELTPHYGVVPEGTYTLALRLLADDDRVVATSEPSAALVVTATELTDFGTLQLTP